MPSNFHRPRMPSLAILGIAIGLCLVLAASSANAANNVRLKGATATTTGNLKIKIDDFGTCRDFLGVDMVFSATRRKFTAFDDESSKFTGTYRQSGSGKRKITFKLDKKSSSTALHGNSH